MISAMLDPAGRRGHFGRNASVGYSKLASTPENLLLQILTNEFYTWRTFGNLKTSTVSRMNFLR